MGTAHSATPGARIIVTGGAGFVGTLLARRLLAGPVPIGGAAPADVGELVIVDLVPHLIRRRLERGVAEGDVPKHLDLEPLVSLYAGLVHALPLRASDGASRQELLAGVTAAMAAWDQLIGLAPRP